MKKAQYVQAAALSLVIMGSLSFVSKTIVQNNRSLMAQAASVGSPAFVQGKLNKVWNGSSVDLTFDTNVSAGNLIAVSTKWESSSVSLNSITASCVSGNLTLVDNPIIYDSAKVVAQGYGVVSSSGSCTITANFSGPAGGWDAIVAHEVSGVNTLDGHSFNKQDDVSGTDAITSGNITTTAAGDYIFGVVWEGGANGPTYTAGMGYTKRVSGDGATGAVATEDKIQTTAGSLAATFTQNYNWADAITSIMAFRAGSGGGTPPPPPPESFTLTVSRSGTGSGSVTGTGISCGSDCSESYSTATNITLTALASSGSTFAGWNGGSCSGTGTCTVTISANTAISATFTQNVNTPPPVTGTCSGSPLSNGLIPSCRTIDWSQSGIPGEIPSRTTVCASIPAGASQTTIQNALNACPANQVVQLATGTYSISTLTIPSNVTLRGAGPQKTILNSTGPGRGVLVFGAGRTPQISSSVSIAGGAKTGSRSLTLASTQGISPGMYLMVTQLNDPEYVSITTNNGTCSWCDGGIGWNGSRVQGQIVEVTSVSGTSVGVSPGLYMDYKLTPLATPFSAGGKYIGVEDLQVYMNNKGYTTNFLLEGTAYSWIKNVESNYTDGDHAQILWGYRNEIRDSYFHDSYFHTPGSTDADVFVANKTSGTLIENNTLRRLHASIMLNWGAAGNVIAYNYMDNNFDSSGYNTLFTGISLHGAHPMFNLIEGNISPKLEADYYWGSSSHTTVFRNWFKGAAKIIPPLTGRAVEDTANSYWASQALAGIDLSQTTRYYNLLGNIIGSDWQKTLGKWTQQVVYPQQRSYYTSNNPYGYSFGFGSLSDQGTDSGNTSLPYSTSIIHGDYDYVKNTFRWDPTITNQTLPSSLYLSSKPAWFGTLSWPAFGPNITNAVGDIPAKYCFDNQKMPNCFVSSGTSIQPAIVGDFDGDGKVNVLDFSYMNSVWNTSDSKADLNKDTKVNTLDVSIMVKNWTPIGF
jgi:hypothetical protein